MIRSKSARAALALVAALALGGSALAQAPAAPPRRPNIVVILIDDAGFTDLGAYGGEARTPTIDRLARSGAMFTGYRASPLCAPSRAMLLTGVDSHRTGVSTIPEVLPAEHRGKPGYSMRLEPGVTTIASRLQAAGYRTYMTGKWHLGHDKGDLPVDHGFRRSFILDASGADNWAAKPYMPYYADAPWFEDGKRATLPKDFYSSKFLVDRMIDYIDADRASEQPFFAYVAFQAVHIPVQAPRAYSDHYRDTYRAGWDVLREDRWRKAKALGLIPQDAPIAPRAPRSRPWSAIPADEQALYAASMAVHAGMLEAMDANLARLAAYLEQRGQLANTVFVITSDNGPEPSEPMREKGFPEWAALQGYSRRLDNLGEAGSYAYIGQNFASATASPGRLFKFYASEGGVHVPLIVSGPGVRAGERIPSLAFVTDIAPTLLDLAGVAPRAAPGQISMTGRSLAPVLDGRAGHTYGPDDGVGLEVSGNAAYYRGNYKLVRNRPAYGDGQWQLYDIAADPGETRDLSAEQADLFRSMRAEYDDYARRVGVLEVPDQYDPQRQVVANTMAGQVGRLAPRAIALAILLAGAISGLVILLRRRRKAAP